MCYIKTYHAANQYRFSNILVEGNGAAGTGVAMNLNDGIVYKTIKRFIYNNLKYSNNEKPL